VYYDVTATRYMLTGARPKRWRRHDTISVTHEPLVVP
jgi:hypothetical protein